MIDKLHLRNRGTRTVLDKFPCKCGGSAIVQEWLEMQPNGSYKRCCMIYCSECSRQTKVKAERTPKESKQEATNEWIYVHSQRKDK